MGGPGNSEKIMSGSVLIFGHGYTAKALSKLIIPQGWDVFGTVRNDENAAAGLRH